MFRRIISNFFIIVAILLLSYPLFSDVWNRMHNSRLSAEYALAVEDMEKEDYEKVWADARAYNERLMEKSHRFYPNDDEMLEYNALLDVTGTGIMGYIEIPVIGVNLPIYHTIEDVVLQVACGHVPGSSLPVGGEGTHTVLSGHTGLSSGKLFTELPKVKIGDVFMLKILDETFTYQVDCINTVLPEELSLLDIEKDKDLCTLVTCTPIGVNSHRLLVRGHRIENLEEVADQADPMTDVQRILNMFSGYEKIMAGIALLLVFVVYILPLIRRKKKEKK